jgi:hypothetical protein
MNSPDFTDFFAASLLFVQQKALSGNTSGPMFRKILRESSKPRKGFRLTGAGADATIRLNFIRNQGVYGI